MSNRFDNMDVTGDFDKKNCGKRWEQKCAHFGFRNERYKKNGDNKYRPQTR